MWSLVEVPPVLRSAALVVAFLGMGAGTLLAVGAASERGESGESGERPQLAELHGAEPDTATPTPTPTPWSIPRLQPARLEVQRPTPPVDADDPPTPLVRLAVSDASLPSGDLAPPPGAPALPAPTPLSAREVEAILAPLPQLPGAGVEAAPAVEAAPVPARVPPAQVPQAQAPPARVVGVFPSGEAEVVPSVTVVFSHPVVPLGATGGAASVPFRWEPEVEGSWHWLDATTARFLPVGGRFPGGQAYRLQVDPELGGVTGEGLSLPLPHEAHLRVRGPLALGGSGAGMILPAYPLLVLGFDQEVDPRVVAERASFHVMGRDGPGGAGQGTVAGAVPRSMDSAPEGEREAVRSGRFAGAAALSPDRPLPPGTWIRLELDAELTSTEGPLPAGRRQVLTFRTADTFSLPETPCPSASRTCTPLTVQTLRFTNPVEPGQPLEERIRVTPEVPGLQFRTTRTGEVQLHGSFQPFAEYRLQVDAELVDVFGSALGESREVPMHFGRALPLLSVRGGSFLSLDPAGSRELEVPVRALDRVEVRIFEADVERWHQWSAGSPSYRARLADRVEGLREVERLELTPDDGGVGFSFLRVPMARALEEAGGQVVVVLSGYQDAPGNRRGTDGSPVREAGAWVQLPSVRVQLLGDVERLVVQTRTLEGVPAGDVRLTLPDAGVEAFTDAEGLASLDPAGAGSGGARILMAESAGRTTLIPSAPGGSSFPRWLGEAGGLGPVWAASVDRPLYRPGEPLAIQGWVQEVLRGEARDVRAPEGIRAVHYEVVVPGGGGGGVRTVHSGELEISATGGFHALVDLPDDLEPGTGRVRLTALGPGAPDDSTSGARTSGSSTSGWTRVLTFQAADFRRPDYQVTVSLPPEVLVQEDTFHLTAEARYFDGPGLPASELRWSLVARPGSYAPPGWQNAVPVPAVPDGRGTTPAWARAPWRFAAAARSPMTWTQSRGGMEPLVHEARTDAQGRHRLEVLPSEVRAPFPLSLVASVTVQDLNRQAGSASTTAVILPGEALPGLRVLPMASTPSGRLVEGDSLEVEVVVLDAEGELVPAHRRTAPEVRVERLAMDPGGEPYFPEWVVELAAPVSCSSARVPAPQGSPHGATVEGYRCRAPLPEAGEWLASVEVDDHQGRRSRAEVNVSVAAPGVTPGGWTAVGRGLSGFGVPGRSGEPLDVEVESAVGAAEEFLPGDTVTLRIRAPFPGGHGVAALDHGGIRRVMTVELAPGATEYRIRFPVEGAPGPRGVEVLLESPRGDRGASGRVGFQVASESRRLALAVEAPGERVEPGATVPVSVRVTGDGDQPVAGAEVTLWLVDEAALFAAGSGAQLFTPERLDPWPSLYQVANGIRARGGLWLHTLGERQPPGEGVLTLRLLDALTGNVPSGTLEVTGSDGVTRSFRPDPNGEFQVPDLPPGAVRVRFRFSLDDVPLDRTVPREGNEGVDLGTLLLPPRVPPQGAQTEEARMMLRAAGPQDLPAPREGGGLALNEVRISATEFMAIEVPPPPDGEGLDEAAHLRRDFTPLAGMEPLVVTDEDGVARTTFRLPDTLTRYRILAVARSEGDGGPWAGAGEGSVVAGQDLVVRATPPRFLRSGDRGEISLLLENGGEEDREVALAIRSSGLVLEGMGGVRLLLPAGARREVRFPARASLPGVAEVQARAVTGAASDAVGMQVAVGLPVAPEGMAFRALLEPGASRALLLEPGPEVSPGWGGLEVVVSPSLVGGLGGELLTLAETSMPWAGLRIARVRGAAALARALERDPSMAALLDPAALATLHRTVEEDLVALGQALRQVRPVAALGAPASGPSGASNQTGESWAGLLAAAQSLGSWSVHAVLEASQALEEARRAGLLPPPVIGSPTPPAPVEADVFRTILLGSGLPEAGAGARVMQELSEVPGERTLQMALLWTLHQGGEDLSSLPAPLQRSLAGLEPEGMRPLWLARTAAILARAETRQGSSAVPAGSHRRFLEALENRAIITPGGVTFRRGPPMSGAAARGVDDTFHFSASDPAEDAEVLLALVQTAPGHPLLPGLVASVAGPESLNEAGAQGEAVSRTPWGPGVVGRALPALEAWAQVHATHPVDTEVRLTLAGGAPLGADGSAPLRVRSGESAQLRRVPMAGLLGAQAEAEDGTGAAAPDRGAGARLSLPLSLEAMESRESGTVSARVLLSWSAADPFQPAARRGFVVRRSYEAVDDPGDVRRDADGAWRIRAGARVRVVHELLLSERRMDIRLEDPFPAGFEPIQGTAGDEGAGRDPGVASAEIMVDGRWALTGGVGFLVGLDRFTWHRELRFSRDQATAWAPTLPAGSYRGSWVARATLPGEYIVPGVRAHEAGRPDVMGRSEAHRVVVEAW